MHVSLVLALFALLFLGSPLYAQSPCSDCLTAAEEGLAKCLANAFSAEDKVACEERRHARLKACTTGVCKIERDERAQRDIGSGLQTPNRPGLTSYTPTKIEWLALALNAQLREHLSSERPYSLEIVAADHETLTILVRYHPAVNRELMNRSITTAREVIMRTAKSYGWDTWVKIQERVELYAPPK